MTAYHNGTTGETYYAKPLPIVASPWDGDDVALTETGTTGWFSFTNDATKAYAVYQQAGESPDATDEAVAQVDADPSVAILTAIDAIEGGGGGDTNVTVVPLTGVVESRTNGTTITAFVGETATVSIAVVDAQGEAVTVTGLTLEIVVERRSLADVVTIANGDITKTGSTISFAIPSALSSTEGDYRWSLRSAAGDAVLLQGPFIVKYAPQADA